METLHCPSEMVFGLEGEWEQSIQHADAGTRRSGSMGIRSRFLLSEAFLLALRTSTNPVWCNGSPHLRGLCISGDRCEG